MASSSRPLLPPVLGAPHRVRRPLAGLVSFVLLGLAALAGALGLSVVSAPTASAAALPCVPGVIYGVDASKILSINTATGAETVIASPPVSSINALGVTLGGAGAYYVDTTNAANAGVQTPIYFWDAVANTHTRHTGVALKHNLTNVVRGGMDRKNDIFYYSGARAGDSTMNDFYAFDTDTDTAIGYVGTVSDIDGGNGDLSFDANGNMLVVEANQDGSSSHLFRVANMPRTAQPDGHVLNAFELANLPATPVNGITFDGNGYLYTSNASTLYQVDPNSGAAASNKPFSSGLIRDLGDCENPGSLQVTGTLTNRASAGDQITVAITGNGIDRGNTGSTTGTGTTTTTAGPVIGVPGRTYTVTETTTPSASLADYVSTLSCVDTTNGNASVPVTAGSTAGTWTVAFPSREASGGDLANVDCDLVSARVAPGLTLTTTPSRTSTNAVGQTTTYTYVATNSGNVALTGVSISDPKSGLSGLTCDPAQPATLAVGATLTCTATRATTQADLTAGGSITSTGTATGTPAGGNAVSDTDGASVRVDQEPAISLTQTADPNPFTGAGQTLTYTFVATNTGNVPLTGAAITATKSGLSALTCDPAQPATLAPGDSLECTATYETTADDVDAGRTLSPATAQGTPPSGSAVTDRADRTVAGPDRTPDLSLSKSSDVTTFSAPGQTVTYTYLATNTGNVRLSGVRIADPQDGLSALTCDPAQPTALGLNAVLTCTATYTTTQADVDAGGVDATATATGSAPTGVTPATVSDTDDAPVTGPALSPALTLAKTADPASGRRAGDVVTYTYVATNLGNTTLRDVSVSDPQPRLGALSCDPTQPARLAPEATLTCTASYTLTQNDVESGGVNTTATAVGTPPTGAALEATDDAQVAVAATPSVRLTKTASPTTVTAAGQIVTFTYVATNTGNLGLLGVSITDPQTDLSTLDCDPAQPAALAPDADLTCTATHRVTQAEVDAGGLNTEATVTGTPSTDIPVTASDDAPVTATPAPAVSLSKTASPTTVTSAGTLVTYTYVARNTGNVTLTGVGVTDPQTDLGALDCDPAQPTTLAPDAVLTCTATYSLTQADVDAGRVNTEATVVGQPPTGDPVSAADDALVTATARPSISLDKTADPTTGQRAGDVVTYTYVATNTGNVTLGTVTVTDPQNGLGTLTCDPAQPATLAPLATLTCTGTYALTQLDVDAGGVDSTADADGLPPTGDPVSDSDDAPVTVASDPALDLQAVSDRPTVSRAGDVVTYTFTATNTGNVTLSGTRISVSKTGLSALSCTPAQPLDLVPNATLVCTATYTATQADLDGTGFRVAPSVAGTPPDDDPVGADAQVVVTPVAAPALSLTAVPDRTTVAEAGDVVTYTFTATNTGSTTLTGVAISDATPGLSALSCDPDQPVTLAPGAGLTCTATYAATQADVDAGSFSTTATVVGTPPRGDDVLAEAGTSVTATAAPSVSLDKTALPEAVSEAGDVIDYTLVVTNTGNVTLSGVQVGDDLPGLSALDCDPVLPATLAPNATATCTATYTATQADLDASQVVNTATVTGTAPDGATVGDEDSYTVVGPATPSVTLVKDADPTTATRAGDIVTYTYTATNSGNVSLEDVRITDPQAGLDDLTCDPPLGSTLAPGISMTCTVTYALTQADVDRGSVDTTATVTGTPRRDDPVTATDDAPVTVGAGPAVALVKTVSKTGEKVGDTWTYTLVATNTGNVTLTGTTITDALPGLSALTCDPAQGAGLAPDATLTCTATYALTQADVDAGGVLNTASVTANGPGDPGAVASDDDALSTPIGQDAELTFTKTADASTVRVGDLVTFTLVAANTGNTTLTEVAITDTMSGLSALACDADTPAVLAPGTALTCTATYTVTAADVAAGSVDNTASAVADDTEDGLLSGVDSVSLEAVGAPGGGTTAPGTLATTGGAPLVVLLLGLLLLGGGGAAVAVNRRRG